MSGIAAGTPANVVGGLLALALIAYLVRVLLRPDRFR
ncbi:K(+)-transporting ATPase subunit F [Actinoalloteichus sp. AHMU CJ021]|nr:K(+)-transporting ATPase subunit F [Actinoalloteichus caeruleus]AUS78035.1 K(+)-transporting ATPase subunit F [Actinoalloteichus sp. AHMU CJ021]